ncbi:MAG: hypothetical protein MOP50_346, partial [Nitrososphaera sp.]|nr:hypothetical protein [Nitrososphaera sp.]
TNKGEQFENTRTIVPEITILPITSTTARKRHSEHATGFLLS